MNKKIIGLVVVILLVIVALFAVNTFLKKDMVEPGSSVIEDDTVVDDYVVTENLVVVPDQAAGSEVFVERVELLDGGYVVIHRAVMDEMDEEAAEDAEPTYKPGVIVGVSDYLEAGVSENFVLALNEGETTEVDEKLFAMLHKEGSTHAAMEAEMMVEDGTEEAVDDEMGVAMVNEEGDEAPIDGDVAVTTMPDESAMDDTTTGEVNNAFNPAEDLPIKDADGKIVMVLFTILADDTPGFETKL